MNKEICAYCTYYDGFIKDKNQFCVELEIERDGTDCKCNRFERKSKVSIERHKEDNDFFE